MAGASFVLFPKCSFTHTAKTLSTLPLLCPSPKPRLYLHAIPGPLPRGSFVCRRSVKLHSRFTFSAIRFPARMSPSRDDCGQELSHWQLLVRRDGRSGCAFHRHSLTGAAAVYSRPLYCAWILFKSGTVFVMYASR